MAYQQSLWSNKVHWSHRCFSGFHNVLLLGKLLLEIRRFAELKGQIVGRLSHTDDHRLSEFVYLWHFLFPILSPKDESCSEEYQ